MPDVPEIPRPSQLWKRLSSERKLLAADAFWQDENAAAEQAEAVVMIAQRIKFRMRSVQTLPREKKSRHLVNLGAVSEMVAARLLVAYHLHHQRAMMAGFLDALGIAHEDGLIADEEMQAAVRRSPARGGSRDWCGLSRRRRRALPLDADVAGPGNLGRALRAARARATRVKGGR